MNPNATNTFDRLEPGDIFLAGDAGWTVEDKSKGSIVAVRGVDNYRHTWTPLDLEQHKARIIMDGRGNRFLEDWLDQTMTDAITAAHQIIATRLGRRDMGISLFSFPADGPVACNMKSNVPRERLVEMLNWFLARSRTEDDTAPKA